MPLTWARCYEHHFAQFFNKPFDIHVYHGDDCNLRIATYDQAYPEFRVYASLGLADLLPEGHDVGEVITVADDFSAEVPFLFVNALFFVLRQQISLGSRFTVGGIDKLRPDFAEFCDKSAFYFMPAEGFQEGFDTVECGGDEGKVYQAVFVSEEEADYIADKGGKAFEERVKAQEADLCRLRRLPCV
jgi:hypothetical protein